MKPVLDYIENCKDTQKMIKKYEKEMLYLEKLALDLNGA